MKFTLSTSGYFYTEENNRKKLEQLGFTFKPSDYKGFSIEGSPEVELNSLEELIEFADNFNPIIISNGSIEIYDAYRE